MIQAGAAAAFAPKEENLAMNAAKPEERELKDEDVEMGS